MNAVEIEQAITALADQTFDGVEFPFSFLEAFGNKPTTLAKLRRGASNKSDLGGVLQTGNIHIAVAEEGRVAEALDALRASSATTNKRHRVRFLLATDGQTLEAEDRDGGDTVACDYRDFPDHFGLFLPLAGISTVERIKENAFDIRATSRLNRLYLTLLEENPDWSTSEWRQDLNHFFARLIFCFFAEDTDILNGDDLFTATVEQMSDDTNTAWVISEIFRAMNTPLKARAASGLRPWADAFPYVNGGLFSGSVEVPSFSRIARRYLLHIGHLDWTKINPDIFGSMIQAVADDEERGALGMHYTSVPNILKVLNPLFLDDLRRQFEEAGGNGRKLLNLRKRMARIRVFDPACGSGNFLVIAYKEMRAIEAEANRRRGEADRPTDIPLTNFRGIEIRNFSAEIARLALIIAEYQCDVTYRGQKEALAEFLPLDEENWITCGNALRLDWLAICPPTGTGVKVASDDLFGSPLDQSEIDFENEGGETYVCGNPPYLGNKKQSDEQKDDLKRVFGGLTKSWRSLDYISGWIYKAAKYSKITGAISGIVSTNSICQGQPVPILWPLIFKLEQEIVFAHLPFRWSNLAANSAGVTVIVLGIAPVSNVKKRLISVEAGQAETITEVDNINAYLVPSRSIIIESLSSHSTLPKMSFGNMPRDAGHLLMSVEEMRLLVSESPDSEEFFRYFIGSDDYIDGKSRSCIWIKSDDEVRARKIAAIDSRLDRVAEARRGMKADSTQAYARRPYRFVQIQGVAQSHSFIIPRHSSEVREYLPIGLIDARRIVADSAFGMYDAELFNLAIMLSRIHLVWIATVCGKLKTDFRYSNTLGWNTFPVPSFTQKNRDDLTACAEAILLTREAHFPATIADLYDPERMPDDLRAAHDANDDTLERIYIGRRFRNDTERLEKLFDLYTKMTAKVGAA